MPDFLSKKKRSKVMASIKSHGNKDTESVLVSLLRSHGLRGWRRKSKLFGKPDLVFSKARIAVFVDGCFLVNDNYEKKGHNYCRMCGLHLRKGYVPYVRLALAYNTNEKFCGY